MLGMVLLCKLYGDDEGPALNQACVWGASSEEGSGKMLRTSLFDVQLQVHMVSMCLLVLPLALCMLPEPECVWEVVGHSGFCVSACLIETVSITMVWQLVFHNQLSRCKFICKGM